MILREVSRERGLLWLFLILLLGAALRIYHLGAFPLWQDEVFSRYYSESPLSYLWTRGLHDESNPPLYFTVMHGWMPLFGTSETALRVPSVFFSLLAIGLAYLIGAELEGRTVGLLGAGFMAIGPTEIWFAQEARTYALLLVPVGLMLWAVARYLAAPQRWGNLVLYALGAIVALNCHVTALLIVAACNLSVLSAAWGAKRLITLRQSVPWFIVNALAIVVTLPVLIPICSQAGTSNVNWMPPLTLTNCVWTFSSVVGGIALQLEFPRHKTIPIVLIFIACLAVALWQRPPGRRSASVILLPPLFFLLIVLLVSLRNPILLDRVIAWIELPLSLLLAQALVYATTMRWPLLVITAGLLLMGLWAHYFPAQPPKEDWRGLLQRAKEPLSRADLVVVAPCTTPGPLYYYAPDLEKCLVCWTGEPVSPIGIGISFFRESRNVQPLSTSELIGAIRSGKKVCYVANAFGFELSDRLLKAVPPPDCEYRREFSHAYTLRVLGWGYPDKPAPQP